MSRKIIKISLFVLLLAVGVYVYAADIKNTYGTNLQHHWAFEETSGNRTDSYASKILIDNNTVAYAVGKQGNAADFERANSESFSTTTYIGGSMDNDYSYSFWIKPESLPTTAPNDIHHILDHRRTDGTAFDYASLMLYRTAGGTQQFQVVLDRVTDVEAYHTHTISAGSWAHVAFVCDVGVGYTLYVNASSIGTGTCSAKNSTGGGANRFKLGTIDTYGRYYDGLLDEFTIWDKALSSGDVTAIYNAGAGIPYDAGGGGASTPVYNNSLWFE